MAKIKLNHNKYAIVDKDDYDFINQWKWRFDMQGYSSRTIYLGGGRKNQIQKGIYMHNLINKTPKGFHTDHINRNKLDNRKSNLRTCSQSLNGINRGKPKNNKSGYKNINWWKNAWVVELKINKIKIYAGRFKLLKDAIIKRNLIYKQCKI